MSLFSGLSEKKFWLDWMDRFEDNYHRYINPEHRSVKKYSEGIDTEGLQGNYKIAEKVWIHVSDSVNYKLSKVWKTPQDTIRSGIGDCEDMVFLIGSILPRKGVNKFELVIGTVTEGSIDEYHTWLRVDGEVIDPTADPKLVNNLTYREESSYTIEAEL